VVEAAVTAALTEQHGITIQDGAVLADWQLDDSNNITDVTFLTPEGTFSSPCSVSAVYLVL